MEVYYYIPKVEVDNILTCGMKLSQWFDKEVLISGERRKCLVALLNPKDDLVSYKDEDLVCIKMEMPSYYCFVADKYLYQISSDEYEVEELYHQSIISLDEYIFGLYRLPECLVTSTVLAGQVTLLDRRMDVPILFDNSEELYINNMVENKKEEHREFNDVLMYCYFNTLCETQNFTKIADQKNRIALFVNKDNNERYTMKIPDFKDLN